MSLKTARTKSPRKRIRNDPGQDLGIAARIVQDLAPDAVLDPNPGKRVRRAKRTSGIVLRIVGDPMMKLRVAARIKRKRTKIR